VSHPYRGGYRGGYQSVQYDRRGTTGAVTGSKNAANHANAPSYVNASGPVCGCSDLDCILRLGIAWSAYRPRSGEVWIANACRSDRSGLDLADTRRGYAIYRQVSAEPAEPAEPVTTEGRGGA